MKTEIAIKPLILVIGLLVSLTIAYAVDPQKCQTVTTTTAGGCSGATPKAGCSGSKTITEHDGCTQCVLGTESTSCEATENLLEARKCFKRNTVIPCMDQAGYCVEGPSGPPGAWAATYEKLCK